MSKNGERNLLLGGLTIFGCSTALALGIVSLPIVVAIGAVGFGAIGIMELMNNSQDNKKTQPNTNITQEEYSRQINVSYKDLQKKKTNYEIGREIKEGIENDSAKLISKYEENLKKAQSQEEKELAKLQLRIAQEVQYLHELQATRITDKECKESLDLIKQAYLKDSEFSKGREILRSALNLEIEVDALEATPSSTPQNPTERHYTDRKRFKMISRTR
jgi:hypothetical protein